MNFTGGRISIEINGKTYSGRGKGTIEPSTVEISNAANQDGSGYSMVKPVLAKLSVSFDRGIGLVWDEKLLLQPVNATVVEQDAGVTHLFTNGNWSGKPSLDTENGEVTGLSIETDKYQGI